MDFDILTGPLSAWELCCVEMVDNVCTRAYMQFDFVYISLTWQDFKVDIFQSIGGVVFPDTCTHLVLNTVSYINLHWCILMNIHFNY